MSTRKDQLLRRAAGKKGRNVALTREEKALRDALEKMGGGDWNASEGEPGHVKNRTHWVEEAEKVIEYLPGDPAELDGFPRFDIGDTVTVNVDGVEHSLVAFVEMGLPAIGDSEDDIINGSGQFGWEIISYPDVVYLCSLELHTVSYTVETVHKLDKKFLPDTFSELLVFMHVEETLGDNKWVVNFSKTYDEMFGRIMGGKPVMILNSDLGSNEILRAFDIRETWIQCSGFSFYSQCEFCEYSIELEDDRWIATRVQRKQLVMQDI